jgi:hypothetical protein
LGLAYNPREANLVDDLQPLRPYLGSETPNRIRGKEKEEALKKIGFEKRRR